MRNLEIDIETYSSANLSKTGVYKYCEAPDFQILLFGYSVDYGEVRTIDLASGEELPKEVRDALTDPSVTKWAFNAQFERVCLSRYLGFPTGSYLDSSQWKCSMIWSAYLGLPLSLESVGTVLGLEKQKLTEGKDLIRYFCVPCKPTKTNGGRTRNMPSNAEEKWTLFKSYNIRDVETEMQIQQSLRSFPVPEQVWNEYHMDQEINDRGILVDMVLADNAIKLDRIIRQRLTAEMREETGLDNPNSVVQMKEWLSDNGLEMETLGKKAVKAAMKDAPEKLVDVLSLRQQLAKSSVKKYQAMQNAACSDHRVRGMFQFYGANRTGRFAGRLVQLQNLPQNHMEDLAEARALVRSGNYEAVSVLYDDVPDTLSQLIRTAFIPKPGMRFYVADFSSIEARVLAWMAGETHTIESFAKGEDLYCATASAMFGVPVVKHGINGELRQKGKVATLACGYGGSVGALISMGALEMGLTEDELPGIVQSWRNANPHIVRFWWDIDKAVKNAVKTRKVQVVHGIRFYCRSGMLFIRLLSGRELAYVKPRIGENRFGGESVTYEGVGNTKKWERLESFGGKFCENIIQATSRDILMHSIETLRNYRIVAHVHDELIIEADKGTSLEEICEMMARVPDWAEGLLLRADGYVCDFYKKD